MPYPENMVAPMRAELTQIGVRELRTTDDVDGFFQQKSGTSLLLINSVCGCAAGSARPGLGLAMQGAVSPDRVATVFAGQDLDATAHARAQMVDIPASSPSMALFKDGKLVHFVPRHLIEGQTAQDVADDLTAVFGQHCTLQAQQENQTRIERTG